MDRQIDMSGKQYKGVSVKRYRPGSRQAGMSLIELVIALAILMVAMAGTLPMLTVAVAGNSRSKWDTQGVQVSQMFLEQISDVGASNGGGNRTFSITDCAGNSVPVNVDICTATAPGCGCPLDSVYKNIDWTQAQSTCTDASSNQYYAYYTTCGPTGSSIYEVRWNVMQVAMKTSNYQMVSVSTRMKNSPTTGTQLFSIPITLHAMYGQ
jgi:prepilin-type N-terminal cleavage/methylation domain-containing protein